MFKEDIFLVQLALFFYGIHNVSLKNIFVSHDGNNNSSCGNWTSPCRTVRHAVSISGANDVIRIEHFNGVAYEECELHNNTILLDKSLTFIGYNGMPLLSCTSLNYAFFTLHSPRIISKFVFSNLSFICANGQLFRNRNNESRLELVLDHIHSNFSVDFQALSCSIHVKNSTLAQNYGQYQIQLKCANLKAHFAGTTFIYPQIDLRGEDALNTSQAYHVSVANCTFENDYWFPAMGPLIWLNPTTFVYKIAVETSIFRNFFFYGGDPQSTVLMISVPGAIKDKAVISLDTLVFEHMECSAGAVHIVFEHYSSSYKMNGIDLGIYNSTFINTSKALAIYTNEVVKIHNNSFLYTPIDFRSPSSLIQLGYAGFYHFSTCYFHVIVPPNIPDFTLIQSDSSANLQFRNISSSFTVINTKGFADDSVTRIYTILSYSKASTASCVINRTFTILCPTGFLINFDYDCKFGREMMVCDSFSPSCQQCKRQKYSLDRGELHFDDSNTVFCHDCPQGGSCVAGKLTAQQNFWGYISDSWTKKVTFQQCPQKYCCDHYFCPHYNSCHGNRTGTLCGACADGMSESLFDTTCKMNKDCTGTSFWPGLLAYLLLYLLFFLYQEDIINFLVTRAFPKCSFRGGRNVKGNGLLKIFFYYYQIIRLLRSVVSSDEKIIFLDHIENVLIRALNFRIIGIPSFDCPFQDLRPVLKTIVLHSVGYSLLVLLGLLYISALVVKLLQESWRRACSWQTVGYTNATGHDPNVISDKFLARFVAAFTNISLLMYGSAAQICLSLLHCVPVGENQVLFLDGNVKCYQKFQYALQFYLIFSILPFCLVPVLGSYLLKVRRIGAGQFCCACILPLPFCCFWLFLLLWDCRPRNEGPFDPQEQNSQAVTDEERNNETRIEDIADDSEISTRRNNEKTILNVLFGSFRSHRAFMCFPSANIPWEGFLIFRRLVLIIVLTFVYNVWLKMCLALVLCVAILMCQMSVYPFRSRRDNVLESFSLAIHVFISVITLFKVFYFGGYAENFAIFVSFCFWLFRVEDILIALPLAITIIVIIVSIVVKIGSSLISFLFLLIQKVRQRLV